MQDSHKSLYAALYEAVGDMQNPVKDSTADVRTSKGNYKYSYATLDQVIGIIRPALRAHGCDFFQRVSLRGESQTLETVIYNEDADLTLDVRTLFTNQDPQKAGSYETYMRRYALMTVFGFAGEDDDGASVVTRERQRPTQARQEAKRANTPPKKKAPPVDEVSALTKKLKEAILASEGGNKEKARERFSEIMKPEGAKTSAAYIRQQLRLFENGPVAGD